MGVCTGRWVVCSGRGICRDSVTYYFSCCSRFVSSRYVSVPLEDAVKWSRKKIGQKNFFVGHSQKYMHIKMAKLGLVSSRISQMAGHAGHAGAYKQEPGIRTRDSGPRTLVCPFDHFAICAKNFLCSWCRLMFVAFGQHYVNDPTPIPFHLQPPIYVCLFVLPLWTHHIPVLGKMSSKHVCRICIIYVCMYDVCTWKVYVLPRFLLAAVTGCAGLP